MKQDKNFKILNEPDIINGIKLPRKEVHIKWGKDNLQLNLKRKWYWSYSRNRNKLENLQLRQV